MNFHTIDTFIYTIIAFFIHGIITIGNVIIWFLSIIGLAWIHLIAHIIFTIETFLKLFASGVMAPFKLIWHSLTAILNVSNKKPELRAKKQNTTRQTSMLHNFGLKLKFFLGGVILTIGLILLISGNYFVHSLPDPKLIGMVNYPVSTKIYDRNSKLLYEIHSDQNRTPIKLADIPNYVWNASVSVEDKNFFSHNGISLYGGIIRAIKDTLITGRIQGGSTITQQLIKTSLLTSERTISRKVREIILALWAERVYSKKQILEMYMNQVPYGGSSYGIEAASQTYFGHSASSLSISEAALLAGLPQAPSKYSPYNNINTTKVRRNEVLTKMIQQKMITKNEYMQALSEEVVIKKPNTYIRAPHFVFYVKAQLEDLFGVRYVEEGGLRIKTTLDLDLQNEAEKILSNELANLSDYQIGNGAALVTIPQTGEILAMVGSKDYYEEPFGSYNVTTALRQPGSSIKPLMYALALQKGYTAASVLDDSPVEFTASGSRPYRPVNYDGQYHGLVPLRYALANSYNIPAVKVLNTLGVENFINFGREMGLTTLSKSRNYGLSITLGGAEVRLVDMAVSFGVFANSGYKVYLDPILSIADYHGENIYTSGVMQNKKKVLSDGVAYIISSILSDNSARESAFGTNSQLVINEKTVAVKTGTSNNKRDNVTIGYTKEYVVAVWVGNNDNQPMNEQLTSGVTGAAPIWHNIMEFVLSDKNKNNKAPISDGFIVPDDIVKKQCFYGRTEYFLKGTEIGMHCEQAILISPTPREIMQ